MATFLGTETYSIDDKNRVGAGLDAGPGTADGAEPVRPDAWTRRLPVAVLAGRLEALEDLLQRLSTGPGSPGLRTDGAGGASKVAVDKQGRITISRH
jgi:DNA-binding transcriptional regulator/RsmH inhibitor MraZ